MTSTLKLLKDLEFDLVNGFGIYGQNSNHPRYNIWSMDGTVGIDVAVLGLSKEDLEVEYKPGILTVRANKIEVPAGLKYLDQGISNKSFTKTFHTSLEYEVSDVRLANGILTIIMEKDNSNKNLLEIKAA